MRHRGLGQVVASRRAAAQVRLRHLDQPHARESNEAVCAALRARPARAQDDTSHDTSRRIRAARRFVAREQQRAQVGARAETSRASSASSGSSFSNSPYEAIAAAHPEAAETIASAPRSLNSRTLARAKSSAARQVAVMQIERAAADRALRAARRDSRPPPARARCCDFPNRRQHLRDASMMHHRGRAGREFGRRGLGINRR